MKNTGTIFDFFRCLDKAYALKERQQYTRPSALKPGFQVEPVLGCDVFDFSHEFLFQLIVVDLCTEKFCKGWQS